MEGLKFSLELGTHSEEINRIQTVEFLQNVLALHGIETRLEGFEPEPRGMLRNLVGATFVPGS